MIRSVWTPVPFWFFLESEVDLFFLVQLHDKHLSVSYIYNYIQHINLRMSPYRSLQLGLMSQSLGKLFGMYVANILIHPFIWSSVCFLCWATWNFMGYNFHLFEILCRLLRIENNGCHVVYLWVPGHPGVEEKEIADKMAKQSLSRKTTDQKVLLGKPECFSICNGKLDKQWQKEWKEEQRGRHNFFCKQLSKGRGHLWALWKDTML